MEIKKVYCDDCQTEVDERETVVFSNDVLCKACAHEDLDIPMDFDFLNEDKDTNQTMH